MSRCLPGPYSSRTVARKSLLSTSETMSLYISTRPCSPPLLKAADNSVEAVVVLDRCVG